MKKFLIVISIFFLASCNYVNESEIHTDGIEIQTFLSSSMRENESLDFISDIQITEEEINSELENAGLETTDDKEIEELVNILLDTSN